MHAGRHVAEQYRQTSVSSAVLEADPHRLIALLLAGAGERIRLAAACLGNGDIPRKAQAIGEACAIIASLNASLDHAAGGEIAGNLEALYDYSQRRLVEANLYNDTAPLHEVAGLLGDIESAWAAIPTTARPEGAR